VIAVDPLLAILPAHCCPADLPEVLPLRYSIGSKSPVLVLTLSNPITRSINRSAGFARSPEIGATRLQIKTENLSGSSRSHFSILVIPAKAGIQFFSGFRVAHHLPGMTILLPKMSNFGSRPAEPGVYSRLLENAREFYVLFGIISLPNCTKLRQITALCIKS
jgi:hypothetical protein